METGVPLTLALVMVAAAGCGPRSGQAAVAAPYRMDPVLRAELDADVEGAAGKSSAEVAAFVLKQMRSPYSARVAPPPVQYALRRLFERDSQFIEKVMSEASDPKRNGHERGRLTAAVGLLGEAAAPAVPRLVSTMADTTLGDGSPVRSGAMVALRGVGRPAVPALEELIRTGTPEQAANAEASLASIAEAERSAVPILLGRLGGPMTGRQVVERLRAVQRADRGQLKSREAQAVLPRVLAIAEGKEQVDQVLTALEAGGLLHDMGVGADRAVAAMVRLMAKNKDEEGAGWGAVGVATFLRPYGGAVGRELAKLAGDGDPAVREVAVAFMALPGVGPGDAAGRIARALRTDREPSVRQAAAAALGGMGRRARGAVGALEEAARGDAAEDVREEAKGALQRIGD